ncbi:predicted protein [Chaetomium globosum CBS 148.51]|uniref:Uncharacterized protein n=1 Tax=Chaetomium globosum (strain ATCC 6205 / CBS 148.51 / DSM 1962 / NBRC 6347 / NRRL 1970) TaxID=306901 RepID=Q2HCS4_CHAGB|nr:uncharacterized protein CHGG_01980 [Chaetomium globosum CBS 148.51]EAQ93745.1 predicted protein [Chaetomium globosum CBS 148.51]
MPPKATVSAINQRRANRGTADGATTSGGTASGTAGAAVAHVFLESAGGNAPTAEQLARLLPNAPAVFHAYLAAIKREEESLIAEVEQRKAAAIAEVETKKAAAIAALEAIRERLRQKEKAFEDKESAATDKDKQMEATLAALLHKIKELAVVVSPQAAQSEPDQRLDDLAATGMDKSSQAAATSDGLTTSIPHTLEHPSDAKEQSSDRRRPNIEIPDKGKQSDPAPDQSNFVALRSELTQYLHRYEVCDSEIEPTFVAGLFVRLLDNDHWRANFEEYHLHGPQGIMLCVTAVAMRGLDCEEGQWDECFCDGDRRGALRGYCVRVAKLEREGGPIRFTRGQALSVAMVPFWREE